MLAFKPPKPPCWPFQGNNSRSYMPQPSVVKGVQGCRLPAFKPIKPFRKLFQGNNSRSYMLHAPAICFQRRSRVLFARLQTHYSPPQAFPRQQLLQPHAPATCFERRSRLPFTRLQTHQTLPQAFPRQQLSQLHATCSSQLFLTAFKAAVCPPSNPLFPSPAGLSKATTLAATCPSHLF